jgi:hypothetical protein
MNEWQASGNLKLTFNDHNVEGFRASSDVRKSYMQEPAVGSQWSMGIPGFGEASAVHGRLPDGMS